MVNMSIFPVTERKQTNDDNAVTILYLAHNNTHSRKIKCISNDCSPPQIELWYIRIRTFCHNNKNGWINRWQLCYARAPGFWTHTPYEYQK